MATSSKLSDRFPNVINPATITVIGSAIGTRSANERKISLNKARVGIPFPTSSSMYFQRNCIKNKNRLNMNVTTKSREYILRMSRSMRFTKAKVGFSLDQ